MKTKHLPFARRLALARQAAGLSQDGLAERSGVPTATIRNLEQGRRRPMLETAVELAIALRVPLDDLIGRCGRS